MNFPKNFIAATKEYCGFDKHIAAPLFRKCFQLSDDNIRDAVDAKILICGLGFYELYINGTRISKLLAPYISAPDDIIYYDEYDISEYLCAGENVLGIILGNGMQNCFGGYVWDFDKARWRNAPEVALRLTIMYGDKEQLIIESDETFKTSPSPIYFDDLRCGEFYDAQNEREGWNKAGFNDEDWAFAIKAPLPKGEPRICSCEPIVITREIKPVSITKHDDGYLYDFGENCAGVCRLSVNGWKGQKISMTHGECYIGGKLYLKNIGALEPEGYFQKDIYVCRGDGTEEYMPRFTYHGFQYVLVEGITEEQAKEPLLTYMVMNTDLAERGGFSCDNETVNILQTLTRRSTLANFYYFPTDCPHREKNGWTGDAALSAEHTLLNLAPEKSYREWLHNIRKSQTDDGRLPGIVPTGGWGFAWGNGPAWDCVLTYLPYFTYIYRNDTEILAENGTAIFRYLHYINRVMSKHKDGLIEIGLGDWCPPGRDPGNYKSPLIFTDSVISMDICNKAAFIYGVLGWEAEKNYASGLSCRIREKIREKLINFETMTAVGDCQTSQVMAIFYNLFDDGEESEAFKQLLALIDKEDGHMDTGILGARVIFHVLSKYGYSNLAFNMITRPDFPSYGNWVARGAASLWEDFQPNGGGISSHNHHFFGDISGWFIKCITGIQYNPNGSNHSEVNIAPSFITGMNNAEGFHITPYGRIIVKWERIADKIKLLINAPENFTGNVLLSNGWTFEDGSSTTSINKFESEGIVCVNKG